MVAAMQEPLSAIRERGIAAAPFGPGDVEAIAAAGGAYILLVRLDHRLEIALPGRAAVRLQPGWFAYAGNARGPGGLRARLRHHLGRRKRPHWHIDRLTAGAAEMVALPVIGGDECELVARLMQGPAFAIAAAGFGSTDCRRCQSHLLRFAG